MIFQCVQQHGGFERPVGIKRMCRQHDPGIEPRVGCGKSTSDFSHNGHVLAFDRFRKLIPGGNPEFQFIRGVTVSGHRHQDANRLFPDATTSPSIIQKISLEKTVLRMIQNSLQQLNRVDVFLSSDRFLSFFQGFGNIGIGLNDQRLFEECSIRILSVCRAAADQQTDRQSHPAR